MFKKLTSGVTGFVKEYNHFEKGSYCTVSLPADCFDRVTWFQPISAEDVVNKDSLETACQSFFERKSTVFGKECDLTYRIKKQGYKILQESIITDPEGKFLSRVINKANVAHAANIWKLLYRIFPEYVPIDWHLDYHSGYRWDSHVYFNKLNSSPKSGVDFAVPLHHNRLYHFTYLGLLYRATGRDEFVYELLSQVLDFIALNPPYFGLNWNSPEEVGTRAVNILFAVSCIQEWLKAQPFGRECVREVLKYLYSCGEFIISERKDSPIGFWGDYISVSALLLIGSFLERVFDEAPQWQKQAVELLKNALQQHLNGDGTMPDASTPAHWYATEALSFSVYCYTAAKQGIVHKESLRQAWGDQFYQRLTAMGEVMYALIKPNGTFPQLGDNPSHRLFKATPQLSRQGYPGLLFMSVLCDEPRWRLSEFVQHKDAWVEASLLFGRARIAEIQSLPGTSLKDIPARAFKDSGWYCLRSGNDYCLASAGNLGKSSIWCAAHNDKLSFELSIHGTDIIVDPGTYAYYDVKERNNFRSTVYHSTISVKNEEQNAFGPTIFSMKDQTRCKLLDFGEDESLLWFEAEHYGYKNIGFIHRRRLEFVKSTSTLVVKDILIGNSSEVKWSSSAVINPSFDVLLLNVQGDKQILISEALFYSEEYGVRVPAKRLETSSLSYSISLIR